MAGSKTEAEKGDQREEDRAEAGGSGWEEARASVGSQYRTVS